MNDMILCVPTTCTFFDPHRTSALHGCCRPFTLTFAPSTPHLYEQDRSYLPASVRLVIPGTAGLQAQLRLDREHSFWKPSGHEETLPEPLLQASDAIAQALQAHVDFLQRVHQTLQMTLHIDLAKDIPQDYLAAAFTHLSWARQHADFEQAHRFHYETLEWLGDAVVFLCVALQTVRVKHPAVHAEFLWETVQKSTSNRVLAAHSRDLGLPDLIRHTLRKQDIMGEDAKVPADVFEAVCGLAIDQLDCIAANEVLWQGLLPRSAPQNAPRHDEVRVPAVRLLNVTVWRELLHVFLDPADCMPALLDRVLADPDVLDWDFPASAEIRHDRSDAFRMADERCVCLRPYARFHQLRVVGKAALRCALALYLWNTKCQREMQASLGPLTDQIRHFQQTYFANVSNALGPSFVPVCSWLQFSELPENEHAVRCALAECLQAAVGSLCLSEGPQFVESELLQQPQTRSLLFNISGP